MREVAQKLCLQLKSEHLDAPLSLQVVKNILYIGKCFCAVSVSFAKENGNENVANMDDDEEDEGDAPNPNPLPWLFSKLSYQIRSAHIGRRNRSFSAVRDPHCRLVPKD
jgi:U3 small nucleolar RNA-associated protein 20